MDVSNYSYVSSSSSTTSSGSTSSTQTQPGSTAAMETNFMDLLLAQLTHQNPMEPMKDAEMMGQMAQLNSLQELRMIKLAMEESATANRAAYASSLVGKVVKVEDDGKMHEGVVTGITFNGSDIDLHFGDETFPIDSVVEIRTEETHE